ncbi:hypothetical protein BT67DRAFT_443754 [Trichocladium antarcticum]|uniref:Uncharacterized protein n=1 Tax=Trichocladium antarcticum TaxID=1450529 RepID=A0AAN6UIZ1_9PEZI|nr:hypothetical protein BT67DRAFT_443754 [Trichocladium antarcticum]
MASSGRVTRSSRKRDFQPESSWRVVEGGENDSFDTSILHDDDDEFTIPSSSDPSSQPFGSQPFSIGGSQDDSIEDFLIKAEDDEQVLLRSPFRPSIPKAVRQSAREDMRHREPGLQFYMPRVEVESPRRPNTRSSATARAVVAAPPSLPGPRRRQGGGGGSSAKSQRHARDDGGGSVDQPASFRDRASASLPGTLFDALSWTGSLIGLALRYAHKPLAILVSLYVTFGGVILLQNMATQSLYSSLSPICRIPGTSLLNLPFCPSPVADGGGGKGRGQPVEFDGLMGMQDQFEQVLEKSAQGVSLPMEMKRSEASIRDLRTMVRYSALQSKDELVLEFDGFIETARAASNDLQKFNTHVGSAVDSVISINRWTSRYLDGLETDRSTGSRHGGRLGAWTAWLLAPFQPAVFSARHLLDQYVEHASLVSDKIADLIVEAQAVLHTLGRAEDHLGIIYDLVTRSQRSVQARRDEILWTLWTLVGANNRRLDSLNGQLSLLRRVDAQRSDAVRQVSELVVELEKIQAGLGDLRERVAEPGLVRGRVEVPLAVHIETINRGVERLEAARSRIRAVENERIREVLARGGARGEERMIGPV